MGYISSCIKKIDDTRFGPMPANRVRTDIVKAVVFGHVVYVMTKTGHILTNGELNRKVCYTGTGSDNHGVLALRALGVITADEQKRHGEAKRRRDANYANYAKYCAVNHAATEFAEAGIELTPRQKRKLQFMKDTVDYDDLPWFVKKEERDAAKAAAGAKA